MTEVTSQQHFGDTLIGRVRALGHPLCVGLDPHLARIPALFRRGSMTDGDPQTAEAVREFLTALVERLAGRVAIVKPQIALFEPLGAHGMAVLADVVALARARGLLVLMDAKRGDIGSTAEGYARAYLADGAPLASDALTVNPYLGLDTLEPYLARVRAGNRAVFVLVKTSNSGSGDFQDRPLDDGDPLFVHVARALRPTCETLTGPLTGWSALGVVAGATYPRQAEEVRTALPSAVLLVPGYGAQGGSARDALRGFVPGPAGLEGGIVNSSRGILFPGNSDPTNVTAWEQTIDAALDQAIDELGNAVSI